MHRILVIAFRPGQPDRFMVTADSSDPAVSDDRPLSIEQAGGTPWEERHNSPGYNAPAATLHLGLEGVLTGLSYWYINKTGKVLDYDFAKAGLSERKVITSGELHVEYEDRRFVARTGDTMMYLTDPNDDRPFLVSFLGDHDCTTVYTDFAVAEPALSAHDEVARTRLGAL